MTCSSLGNSSLTLVSRLFFVFFLCLSSFFSFLIAFAVIVVFAMLIAFVELSETFAKLSFAIPSWFCLLSCPSSLRLPSVLGRDHHPQPPGNSSMQLEELRNLLDSELANTS